MKINRTPPASSVSSPVGIVPEQIEELCGYINEKWNEKSPLHVMWRLNWIHPFTDGNGMTSRAASYMILCVKLGYALPGKNTIPDQIAADKTPYDRASKPLTTLGARKNRPFRDEGTAQRNASEAVVRDPCPIEVRRRLERRIGASRPTRSCSSSGAGGCASS